MTKLLKLAILFSTAVGPVGLPKLLGILGILLLTSFILALRAAVVDKLLILGNLLLTSFILALRVVLVVKFVISGNLSSIYFYLSIIFSLFNNNIFYCIS